MGTEYFPNFSMQLPIAVSKLLSHPELWRFIGVVSNIVGFSCYAMSPSFEDLFGKWNPPKIAIYNSVTLLFYLLMLFVNKWKELARPLLLKAHVGFLVLMLTSLYSFFEGQSEGRSKQKAYGSMLNLISCGAFALMSLSLSRQLELGFDAGMFNFFLGCFLVTVMKMNYKLAPVAAIFCYLLVNFRSCSNCFMKILGREIERADVESGPNMEAKRIHGSDKADDNDDGMQNNSYGYREWEFEDENDYSYHAMFKEMDEYENKNKNKNTDLYDAMFIEMDEYCEDN